MFRLKRLKRQLEQDLSSNQEKWASVGLLAYMNGFGTYYLKRIGGLYFIFTIILVFSYSQLFNIFEPQNPEVWFQRSGSIIVLIALCLELHLLAEIKIIENFLLGDYEWKSPFLETAKVNKVVDRLSEHTRHILFTKDELLKFQNKITKHLVLWAVIGTLIWGYGDLFYLYLNPIQSLIEYPI